ncbi:MAG: hypothetical protein KGJ77_11040 [Acidobacteriota bacterium]|nr:hypothetical protein [Acidobacteriota bacterium]
MIRLVRAEVFKLRTVWSTWLMLGITALLVIFVTGLTASVSPDRRAVTSFPARGSAAWLDIVFSGMTVAVYLAIVLGAVMITGEHRHKTITPTFLAEPRRGRTVAAKLVVALGGGLVVAVVAGFVALGVGLVLVGVGVAPLGAVLTEYRHVWPGVAAACVLYGAYGVGLGALLKNQVVTIVVALVAIAIVEPIIGLVAPAAARWLPGSAAQALESLAANARSHAAFGGSGGVHLVVWWVGALLLVGYGVVLAALGSLTTLRADVT